MWLFFFSLIIFLLIKSKGLKYKFYRKVLKWFVSRLFYFKNTNLMDQKMAQDWPYLNKYKKANSLLENTFPEKDRIVFMGDSITEFWTTLCPEFFAEKQYINRGISGQTTPQMLVRFRADVINLKPKVVVLLAGANDIAENTGPSSLEMITNNLFSMADLAKAHDIKVILCSVLPALLFPWNTKIDPAEKIVNLNKMIQKYASENQHFYLDYYSAMVDANKGLIKTYSDDGMHPNKTGYELMIPLVGEAIAKVLHH
jgi:lysophospholipase L1-like esterase